MTRIPTPFGQRMHEFRTVYLPTMTFLLLVGAILLMWKHYITPTSFVASEIEATGAANFLTDAMGIGQ